MKTTICTFRDILFAIVVVSLGLAGPVGAGGVDTDFTEATIAATGLSLDVPIPANGNITLDTVNDYLVATITASCSMYSERLGAPFAYALKPSCTTNWYMETDVELLSDDPENPTTTDRFNAGLTVYEDTDGFAPDFTYTLQNWPNYATKCVQLQGMGDNIPSVALDIASTVNRVTLRIEVEEDGDGAIYKFYYDLNDANGMQYLTTYASSIDNSRGAVFIKGADYPNSAAFHSFEVGPPDTAGTLIYGR